MNEQEFNDLIGLRYSIDFRVIPKIFIKSPSGVLGALMNDEIGELLSSIFNDVYEGKRRFVADDFKAIRHIDEDDFVYYVDLPDEHDGSIVWCAAYGFAFVRDGDAMAAQFFTVEESDRGPKMLCGLDVNLDHLNFGHALASEEENAAKMLQIAKSNVGTRNPTKIDF